MEHENVGERLLAEQQELEVHLLHAGQPGLVSLIAACIRNGWNTEEAIVTKVRQIGGPYYDHEVPVLLHIHSSPLARPHLWDRDHSHGFKLRETNRG